MSIEWIGQLQDAATRIGVVIDQQRDIAEALEVVGNYRLAATLRRNIECLALAQTDLRNGAAGATDAYVSTSTKASANMVNAALAAVGSQPLYK